MPERAPDVHCGGRNVAVEEVLQIASLGGLWSIGGGGRTAGVELNNRFQALREEDGQESFMSKPGVELKNRFETSSGEDGPERFVSKLGVELKNRRETLGEEHGPERFDGMGSMGMPRGLGSDRQPRRA